MIKIYRELQYSSIVKKHVKAVLLHGQGSDISSISELTERRVRKVTQKNPPGQKLKHVNPKIPLRLVARLNRQRTLHHYPYMSNQMSSIAEDPQNLNF
jgi:hypothetical protein